MSDYTLPGEYAPPPPREKKPRGCFFYGCLFSAILAVLLIVLVAGGTYLTYRYAINTAKDYTETVATPMPAVEMPEPDREALRARFKAYGEDLKAGKATEPLVLNTADVNALIDDNPKLKGRAHVDLSGDEIEGKISFPLKDLDIDEVSDRYLNGSATLRIVFVNGTLVVHADDVKVKGKPLPDWLAKALREQNIARDATDSLNKDDALANIESIVVKDGTIIVTPRTKKPAEEPKPESGNAEPAKDDDTPKDAEPAKDDDTPKVAEPPPAEKAPETS